MIRTIKPETITTATFSRQLVSDLSLEFKGIYQVILYDYGGHGVFLIRCFPVNEYDQHIAAIYVSPADIDWHIEHKTDSESKLAGFLRERYKQATIRYALFA